MSGPLLADVLAAALRMVLFVLALTAGWLA